MVGFTRTIPLGGDEMDRAVRDKLSLEDMEAARKVKEEQGTVISTEFEVEGEADSVNLEASEAITAVADRLINELRRSLDFYISQPDGVAVDSVVLSGGLACLRHVGDYIEEKMGLPVTIAECKHEQIRLPDGAPDPFCPYAIAMGLAMQGLGLAQNRINFLPEDIKTVRGLQERKLEVAAMVTMLAVIVGLSFDIGNAQIAQYNADARRYAQQIAGIAEDDQRIRQAEDRHNQVFNAYSQLSTTTSYRDILLGYCTLIVDCRPPEVLIDNLTMRLDGVIVIEGVAKSNFAITQMVEELRKQGEATGVFEDASIYSIEPRPDPRFGAQMQAFTVLIKAQARKGRLRIVGERPGIYREQATTPSSRRRGR
jgi:hypothetical protein